MARQDDYTRMQIRLPNEVHAAVQAEADARGCSMNAEIIRRLTSGVDDATLARVAERERLNDELTEAMNEQIKLTERQKEVLKQYRTALTGIVKDVIGFLESETRSMADERAMMLMLVKLMAQLQEEDS